ncbi:hypothetical protein N802_06890 [Knoellia sinensis KCTC 19936]|uniref:Uncharacterized protein n=1 Tax=Knoellia sinensis KCTC 19936 TaxID=1385520 RepID=A0A0A0J349_9MICO|nr:hypothetical protein N802_06890 [Knoellia sinensis KCTC 19936]
MMSPRDEEVPRVLNDILCVLPSFHVMTPSTGRCTQLKYGKSSMWPFSQQATNLDGVSSRTQSGQTIRVASNFQNESKRLQSGQ